MTNLIYYLLSSIGLMCILKYGSILAQPRAFLSMRSLYLSELFSCSLCLGFWAGFAIMGFIYFCTEDWAPQWFLFPLVSAVLSWLADPLIGIVSYTEKYLSRK